MREGNDETQDVREELSETAQTEQIDSVMVRSLIMDKLRTLVVLLLQLASCLSVSKSSLSVYLNTLSDLSLNCEIIYKREMLHDRSGTISPAVNLPSCM